MHALATDKFNAAISNSTSLGFKVVYLMPVGLSFAEKGWLSFCP